MSARSCIPWIRNSIKIVLEASGPTSDQIMQKFAQGIEQVVDAYFQGICHDSPEFQASIKCEHKSHRHATDTLEPEQ